MPNLNINELMRALVRIRDNIDKVEVRGHSNQEFLVTAYNECNSLLRQLGMILDEISKIQDQQTKEMELKEVTIDEADENA